MRVPSDYPPSRDLEDRRAFPPPRPDLGRDPFTPIGQLPRSGKDILKSHGRLMRKLRRSAPREGEPTQSHGLMDSGDQGEAPVPAEGSHTRSPALGAEPGTASNEEAPVELGDYSANRRRAANELAQRQMEGQDVSRLGELAQRDDERLAAAQEQAHPEMTEDPGRMQRMFEGMQGTSDEPTTDTEDLRWNLRSQTGAQ